MFSSKPNFLCIGVQKAGTTSLISYFNQHPDIFMYPEEIHFFDIEYHKGIKYYESKFKSNKLLIGEKTPIYCYNKNCIDRIYKHYPKIKLILILREPIQRAYSQWNMCQYRDNSYPLKNVAFIDIINNDLSNNNKNNFKETDILQRGYYDIQIEYILKKFSRKNLYIGISEEIKQNKELEYSKIFKFLGVSNIKNFNIDLDKNINNYKFKLSKKDKQYLYRIYKPHIENLYLKLGRRIKSWEDYYKINI